MPKLPVTVKSNKEMSSQFSVLKKIEPLALVLSGVFLVSLALIFVVVFEYRSTFSGKISHKQEVWGQFGDFMGGTLNPILGFLSFIALLTTIWLQSRELKLSNSTLIETQNELRQTREIAFNQSENYRIESEKAEVKAAIEIVRQEIEAVFSQKVDFCTGGRSLGYYFSNSAPSSGLSVIPCNTGSVVSDKDRVLLIDLLEYVRDLDSFLYEYISKFGTSAYSYHYQKRYSTAVRRLSEKGFIHKETMLGFKSIGHGWSAQSVS